MKFADNLKFSRLLYESLVKQESQIVQYSGFQERCTAVGVEIGDPKFLELLEPHLIPITPFVHEITSLNPHFQKLVNKYSFGDSVEQSFDPQTIEVLKDPEEHYVLVDLKGRTSNCKSVACRIQKQT